MRISDWSSDVCSSDLIVFNEIKKNDAPLYQNKSTVESVELLLNYNVNSFVGRVINTPVMMVVAEGDDITLWDLEIDTFNAITFPRKELVVLPHTTHITRYRSEESRVGKEGCSTGSSRRAREN